MIWPSNRFPITFCSCGKKIANNVVVGISPIASERMHLSNAWMRFTLHNIASLITIASTCKYYWGSAFTMWKRFIHHMVEENLEKSSFTKTWHWYESTESSFIFNPRKWKSDINEWSEAKPCLWQRQKRNEFPGFNAIVDFMEGSKTYCLVWMTISSWSSKRNRRWPSWPTLNPIFFWTGF